MLKLTYDVNPLKEANNEPDLWNLNTWFLAKTFKISIKEVKYFPLQSYREQLSLYKYKLRLNFGTLACKTSITQAAKKTI